MRTSMPVFNLEFNVTARQSRTILALLIIALLLSYTPVNWVNAAESSKSAALPDHTSKFDRPGQAPQGQVARALSDLPLTFEANQGQTDRSIRFLTRSRGYSLFLTATEAVLTLNKPSTENSRGKFYGNRNDMRARTSERKSVVLRMKLVGANSSPKIEGLDHLPGKSNYLIGSDPKKWQTNVSNYSKVKCHRVYPGVDMVYYGNEQQLEYDFIVAAGADPSRIRLEFNGADKLRVDAQGDLVLHTASGEIRHHKPLIYQEVNGTRREIPGEYVLRGKNQVSFQVGAYDASTRLVIDPAIVYSTYLGGSLGDSGVSGIATYTDAATGKVYTYVVGNGPADYPTKNAMQLSGVAFVTKLDTSASGAASLVYSTFFGGSGGDEPRGIAVDSSGNAYIAGRTTSYDDFPLVKSPMLIRGGAFITELNATGTALVYSMSFGGDGADAIAVDPAGNAYVTGGQQGGVPTTPNAYQSNGSAGKMIAFVSKIAPPSGSYPASFAYSTYLHGDDESWGHGIAVDSSGNIYVTGNTDYFHPFSFPVINGFAASGYGFMAKLNPSAYGSSSLVYSTDLGGGGRSIAVDSSGIVYVLADASIIKINPSQVGAASLVYSRGVGIGFGCGWDVGAITVDSAGNAYVAGAGCVGGGVFQSVDGGNRFTGLNKGFDNNPNVSALAIDTSTVPRTLYAGTSEYHGVPSGGILKSTDGGNNWSPINNGITNLELLSLAISPANPSTLYAGTYGGIFKSTDGGGTWFATNSGLSNGDASIVRVLAFDNLPTYSVLYAGTNNGLYRSSDGGNTWSATNFSGGWGGGVESLVIDPKTTPHTLYVPRRDYYSSDGDATQKSTDGGNTWTDIKYKVAAVDTKMTPSTLYASNLDGWDNGERGFFKSTDGGTTWECPTTPDIAVSLLVVIDPTTTPSTLYATRGEIIKSTDGGITWSQIVRRATRTLFIDTSSATATTPSTLYLGTMDSDSQGFIAELDPTGSTIFTTYLGGFYRDIITGIALDSSGNIYVAGWTQSFDFPVVNAFQSSKPCPDCFGFDSFVAKLGNATLPPSSTSSVTTQVAVETGTLALSFPNITGSTTGTAPTVAVTPIDSSTAGNFALSNNLGAFDIKTTATYNTSGYATDPTKGIKLTFSVPTVNDLLVFNGLVITHGEDMNGDGIIQANEMIPYNGSVNPNKITYHDFASRTVWVYVPSLSPFVITKGATDQLSDLIRLVKSFNLQRGIANSLDAKLQNAQDALTAARSGNRSSACNSMSAFVNEAQAQSGRALTVDQASKLIAASRQIRAVLGCP
jgi:photosystem II stability/assembly factor-like uncharacterized protein